MDDKPVLVIDEAWQSRHAVVEQLEAAGYAVITASIDDAFVIVDSTEPALVIIGAPSTRAVDLCNHLRAKRDTPLLIITEPTGFGVFSPTRADVLARPFHQTELLVRVETLLRQHRTVTELRATIVELDERNRRQRELEQFVVHDLKTPAQAILANAELLGEYGLAAAHHQAIGDIIHAVQQLDRTVEDLLALSRSEDAQLRVCPTTFDLHALAECVARTMRIGGRFHRVGIELAIEVDMLSADRELVRRVLENLVDNALRHAPHGTTITIGATGHDGGTILRVDDEGPGIPADDAERIFDPFTSLRRGPRSHGLGLASCKRIAMAHGGEIWVTPRTPRGASFHLHLPTVHDGVR